MMCPGKAKGHTCNRTVYRCKHCSSVGCENKDCGNYNFNISKCMKCGKSGKEPQR